MNYQEAIDFLFSRLPVFQNVGSKAFKPGLETTRELCTINGNPQNSFQSIHVGGTNGKGSTSHMLAAILQQAGYRVGLYTSPHLKSFKERIKVNGIEIREDFIPKFINVNLSNIDKYAPSFFELTVCMAFKYFEEEKVDYAIIEVGMGGRLDSTNVISPILSIITNVSFDHVQFLGDTLPKIAFEKAGIIKNNTPTVISEYDSETAQVFDEIARERNSLIYYASEIINIVGFKVINGLQEIAVQYNGSENFNLKRLQLDLNGEYQFKNIKGILVSLILLRELGLIILDKDIVLALVNVCNSTGFKGRWQKLQEEPSVYCDTAHNYAGLYLTIQQFLSIPAVSYRFVLGFVSEKDVTKILKLFPKEGIYYFCQPSNSRALDVILLKDIADDLGLNSQVFSNVNDALEKALEESQISDIIYVGGSTFVVADIKNL